jgi:hypothetical protein
LEVLSNCRRTTLRWVRSCHPLFWSLADLMLRWEERRDDCFTQEDFGWLWKARMGLLRKRRTSRHLRREQRGHLCTKCNRREIRQSRDTCRYAWYGSLHKFKDIVLLSQESLCDNKEIIERNIRSVKISSPDVRLHLVLIASTVDLWPSTKDGTLTKPSKTIIFESVITKNIMKQSATRHGLISKSLM